MRNPVIPPSHLRQIATNIMDGKTCYIGVSTAKIEYTINEPSTEKEIKSNEKLLGLVNKRPESYLKIPDLPKEDLLMCMSDFTLVIKDNKKAKELKNALNRPKPTRNFMQSIDSDLEYSLYWESYAIKWRTEWVADFIIAAYNY